jgi:cytochrome oxidase Cu insertion factor (SCO1/SenC/PrrC family)
MNASKMLVGVLFTFVLVSAGTSEPQRGPQGRYLEDSAPKVGELAPLFTLKSLDGTEEFSLEACRGSKPVVLLFGSYT